MLHCVGPAVPRLLDYPLPLLPHDELLLTRADGSKKEEQMIRTDDGGYIPDKYSEFVEVFSKTKADTLSPHRTDPSTMQSTWNRAARYHMDGSTTSRKWNLKRSKHTSKLT